MFANINIQVKKKERRKYKKKNNIEKIRGEGTLKRKLYPNSQNNYFCK
jgi:ribosomal protein L25 (general stress protein Ctc)